MTKKEYSKKMIVDVDAVGNCMGYVFSGAAMLMSYNDDERSGAWFPESEEDVSNYWDIKRYGKAA